MAISTVQGRAALTSSIKSEFNGAAHEAWKSLGSAYGLRTNVGASYGQSHFVTSTRKGWGLVAKRNPIPLSINVFGDEVLIKRLMRGHPQMARHMKRIRRKAATKTVVPAVRHHIPKSSARKRHLRNQFRVRRVRLEGTWVAAGDQRFFYAAALNARVPYVQRGLKDSQEAYADLYRNLLGSFQKWMVTGRPIGVVI